MKALAAGLLLVLAFIVPLLTITAARQLEIRADSEARNRVLSLEYARGIDLSFKNALQQTLRGAGGATRKQAIVATALELVELEKILEEDPRIEVWVGSATQSELDALPARMLDEGKPLACASCGGLGAPALDWTGAPLPAAAAFLDYAAGDAVVSRNGGNLFVEPPTSYGEAGFGLSYCDGETAAVYFAGEGFK
ncbi:MAG: hypothetical protein WC607_00730 [Candidatus Micrarchaeia archaeon]